MTHFNNPAVYTQGWYPAVPSRQLRAGRAITVDLLGRGITLFRDAHGAHALDARCPHLGADLGLGRVSDVGIRCAFHGWTFDGSGRCATRDGVRATAYAVEERYGLIWIFNGPVPLFPLPALPGRPFRLPTQTIRAHPHIIAGNGLDTSHFATLHQMRFLEEPRLEQPDRFHTRLTMRVRFDGRGSGDRLLRLAGGRDVAAEFTTHGANLSTIDGRLGRTAVRVLFSHTPLRDGSSRSRTVVFAETIPSMPLVLATVARIVVGDRRLLDRLEFRPNLTESDWAFAAFMRQVEALPLYPDDALSGASDRAALNTERVRASDSR